ncbi:MAG: hypothetical protein K2Y35_21155 [Burkholderiales bacterium]|nr:hypothetical protein [Burkholderiales bacterium]
MHRIAIVSSVIAACFLCGSAQAATPSFVCTKAKTWVETTVCGSDRLSELDLQLAVAYARLLKVVSGEGRKTLEAEQRTWWSSRNDCRKAASPVACLEGRYERQIAALESRPDYPGETVAKNIELPPEPIANAGRGWTRELSKYQKALRACREESSVAVSKVLVAWTTGDDEASVGARLVDWNLKEWVCVAHVDGHKVFRFEARDPQEQLPPSGPVYHLAAKAPPGCKAATQVLDVNGKAAGWISEADC